LSYFILLLSTTRHPAGFTSRVRHPIQLSGQADWQQSTDVVIENYKYIGNLEKGTYYEVRMVAFDGFRRDFSDVQTVGTDGFGMYLRSYIQLLVFLF